jgi:hypothetical protein
VDAAMIAEAEAISKTSGSRAPLAFFLANAFL